MATPWDAREDFAKVVDALEPVTLCRRGRGVEEHLQGWRVKHETAGSPTSAAGAVIVTDTTWQLPLAPGGVPPRPGDSLRSSGGGAETIRQVDRLRGATRWVCVARSVELSPLQAERFTLERPIYANSETPTVATGWAVSHPHVVAWVDRSALDQAPTAPDSEPLVATAYLPRPINLRRGERLLSDRGEDFRVESVEGQASPGDPFLVRLSVAD